jgi:hypothetical protein
MTRCRENGAPLYTVQGATIAEQGKIDRSTFKKNRSRVKTIVLPNRKRGIRPVRAHCKRMCSGRAADLLRAVLMAALCLVPLPRPAHGGSEAYTVEFQGVPHPELRELLQSVSDSYAYREQTPPSVRLLENRARNDIPRLLEALASWGYFKAGVEADVRADPEDADQVVFRIFPGPRFPLEEVRILDAQGAP